MSQSDASGETGDAAGGPARESAETGSEYVPQSVRTVRRGIDSGAVAALGAGATLVSGLRALRRGDRGSAFTRIVVSGLLATVAAAQRRSARDHDRGQDRGGVTETDVVDTAPDLEDAGAEDESAEPERATGDEASEVVDTAPDIEGAATGTDDGARRASGSEASDVVDTAPDVGSVEPDPDVGETGEVDADAGQGAVDQTGVGDADVGGTDVAAGDDEFEYDPGETAVDADEADMDESGATTEESDESAGEIDVAGEESYDRLGEAAFDEQSGRVPAPQEAFNLGLLSSGAEVFWGLDESGDYVIVTMEYDMIDEAEGFSYVASSEVDDDDRGVRIPDTVQNHWDDVAGGGSAVTSGTGLVFVTSDDLREEDLLLVVPEQWIDELLEESEE